jgi:hypothetical protein
VLVTKHFWNYQNAEDGKSGVCSRGLGVIRNEYIIAISEDMAPCDLAVVPMFQCKLN